MKNLKVNINSYEMKGFYWEVEHPIANIVIITGMEETSARYDKFATALNEKGYSCYCLDHFGQGENVKEDLSNLGVWPKGGHRTYLKIIHEFIGLLKKNNNIPVYIFSHSMGSFMTQGFIQGYPYDVDKVILCGSGCKNPVAGLGSFLAKITCPKGHREVKSKFINYMMFGSFNKKIKHPRTSFDWLSVNEENVDRYIADPKCGFGPNKGFCIEFLGFLSHLWDNKKLHNININLNIMLMAGEGDPVTGYSKGTLKLEKMYKDLGVRHVTTKIYKNARHEILNECDDVFNQALNDVLEFYSK